ncbi:prephenate dehydratase [Cohnella kolymensis]|uniref:Prephenate dehydratase n=1 Tax=Cohnella kolymensis TaxID=1590652 RepID=A0ABR5A0A8_9BACL|nr:prephenate dehydratase [Cohnella kolymensis]KIL34471.1 prephenate dehydratase [Cohnella kolymensis]
MSARKSVALLPKSTVSDEAVRYLFRGEDVEYVYCKMISDVFLSTAKGNTDWSVIPIENTIDGSVSLHMDWLVHEVDLPIRAEWVYPSIQNLIGRSGELSGEEGGWDPHKITKVMSHPVAMAQCLQFIRANLPHAELETFSSTSEAVRMVKENPGRGWAAIGTRLAASDLDLDVLQARVTDHDNNFTRFLLVGNTSYEKPEAVHRKTSILITLPEDYPGALHQVLSAFAWRRINLSRIESRPTKKKLGSYYFYIDIEYPLASVLLTAAFAEIEAIGCQVRILGSYPSLPFQENNAEV